MRTRRNEDDLIKAVPSSVFRALVTPDQKPARTNSYHTRPGSSDEYEDNKRLAKTLQQDQKEVRIVAMHEQDEEEPEEAGM